MNIINKLIDILSLQSIAVKVKSVYKNIQKVFDAGYAAGYEEGVETDPQWNAYCLKTGEHFDLPEGMTEIPEYMFYNHVALKTVSIPDTVTKINGEAFMNSYVQIRQFPESLQIIADRAFCACPKNDVIVLPPSIEILKGNAFASNSDLTEVTFVKTANKSGTPTVAEEDASFGYWNPFYGCGNLKTINVPWSEDDPINKYAPFGAENATIVYNFWDTAITSEVFTFPQGFIKIPDYLFYDTTATTAKEIYLGDECEEIGEAAFYKAQNLETVHLPEGLKKIGAYAFRYSSALNCSELPDSVEEIANRAFHGSSVSLSKLPKNIKKINVNAFQNCANNTFTEIPEGVELIASGAFLNNTGLTKVYFTGTPMVKKVTNGIANNAFEGCTNLVEIGVPWSEGQVSGAPWGAENATIIYDWEG